MKFVSLKNSKKLASVDDEDFDVLCQITWYVDKRGYIRGRVDGKTWYMHRFILHLHGLLSTNSKLMVNHIDENPSNNQKENLEQVTNTENQYHSRVRCTAKVWG